MNKANVFLLVVVSSLLTYISTATQPAATAGVAQEKWDYGQSAFLTVPAGGGGEFMSFEFHFSDVKSDSSKSRYVSINTNSGFLSYFTFREPRTATQKDGDELEFNFRKNVRMLWREIGANGWEPYLVIPQNPSGPREGLQKQYEDTVYWRRRVQ